MAKKNNVEIIDNGNGSKSAVIEIVTPRSLAIGSTSGNYGNITDMAFEMATGTPNTYRISSGNEAIAKQKILKTLFYWEKDPMVYKCITLMAQLANDTFSISCENKKTELELRSWWKGIKGDNFLEYFFLEYFRSGTVPILKTNIERTPKNGYKGSVKTIPGGYTILNPLNISLQDSGIPSLQNAYLTINSSFLNLLDNKEAAEKLKESFPSEIIGEIKSGNGKILLPTSIFSIVSKDKQPYEAWAMPMTSHAFDSLDFKRELMEMDRSTSRGIKNRILKVTIGSDTFPVTDTKELTVLANKFKTNAKNLTIFWNHTLNIEYIEPDLSSLNADKYQSVNDEIRSTYGITPVLLGTEGASSGNNSLCLKGMIEMLEQARTAFITWFDAEIMEVSNLITKTKEEDVSVAFGSLNLKDENDYFRVIMQMVDRQVISYETAMETIGYHFPKELKRLESEKKTRDEKGILIAQKAPTQGGNSGGVDQAAEPSKTGGRPKGGNKEMSRPNSKDKPKRPSGIKLVAEIKKDISLAIANGGTQEEVKSIAKKAIANITNKENSETIAYLIDNSKDFTKIDETITFIEKIAGLFDKS